jgi:hypothetical protein
MRRLFNRKVRRTREALFAFCNTIIFIFKWNKNNNVNEKEIKIIGMQRTGNHAIVNWIYSQCDELKCVLNNIPLNRNPFIAFSKRGTVKEFDQNFKQKLNITAERLGFFARKKLLIYTYEDELVQDVFNKFSSKKHDSWVGKSKIKYDLLIIRDPFNLFASRLKRDDNNIKNRYSLRNKLQREKVVSLWKNHAREFLGDTDYLSENKVCVNYNLWFTEKKYRKQLAEKLNIKFTDQSINEVLHIGGGSSFDRTELNNEASKMKVLERWQEFAEDEGFISIFKDKEIIELYNRIFAGTAGEPTGRIKEFLASL